VTVVGLAPEIHKEFFKLGLALRNPSPAGGRKHMFRHLVQIVAQQR
jgi:hypothetical protein